MSATPIQFQMLVFADARFACSLSLNFCFDTETTCARGAVACARLRGL